MFRIIILLLFLFLFDWYAFQGIKLATESFSTWAKSIIYSLYWMIPVLALGMMLTEGGENLASTNKQLFGIIRAIVTIAYFSKFLMVVVLFGDDLRRAVMSGYEAVAGKQGYDYTRSKFLSRMAIVVGSIPFITLTYGMLRNKYRYRLFKETVAIKDLPDELEGLKIVQISDIHSGSFTMKEPVKSAIDLINQQKADLVFFTGDLVNSVAAEMENYIDVFDKIKARLGVFSVLGNHDYGDYVRWPSQEAKRENFDRLLQTHKQLGWDLLMNENRLIEVNNQKLAVIGVENYSAHPRFPKYGNLAKAYEGSEEAALKLLLSHDPSHWKDQVTTSQFNDIDITFSGHTHGMQFGIEIPGWIKWSPIKYVYKEWAGLYQQGQQYLYVNRGLGFLGYPGRVGILPEITVIDLKKKMA